MKRTKHHHGHRWTDEELKELIRLWDNDVSPDQIANQLGSTVYAIDTMVVRLRQNGIPLKRKKGGHAYGQRAGKPWTQGEIEYLVRRRNERATGEEIARELGRTHSAIEGMVQALRRANVPIAMKGNGVRRLWDPDRLRATLVITKPEDTNIIRLDEALSVWKP